MNFFKKFALYFGYIVPVAILIIVNILIIYKATEFSRAQKALGNINISNLESERKKAHMTKTILFLTAFYIALSLPLQIYAGYLYVCVDQLIFGQMISNIINFFQYFYSSFQIIILYFSNKRFSIEFKRRGVLFRRSILRTLSYI